MRIPHRRIRNKLEAGDRVFGVTIQLSCPEIAEIAGYAGLDFVWIDAEHGTLDLSDIGQIVRGCDAAGIDAIVRVPDHSPSFIQRVLDTGAAGIMVPHVRTVADAKAAVAAAKFAPAGIRGACPATRASGHYTDAWPEFARQADSDVLVFGLIEDLEGVENVEAIAGEAGLDALVFGPFDLAQALGSPGDIDHPDIDQMGRRVAAAVVTAGIGRVAITGWQSKDDTDAHIFLISGDRGVLFTAFQAARAQLVSRLEQTGAPE